MIAAVRPQEIEQREKELLKVAARLMPRLPFREVDILVIDDWWLLDSGAIDEESFGDLMVAAHGGRMGNWMTVNGTSRPTIAAPAGERLRLRLINAANARVMRLTFRGADPRLLAIDGQPLKPGSGAPRAPILPPPAPMTTEGRGAAAAVLDDDEIREAFAASGPAVLEGDGWRLVLDGGRPFLLVLRAAEEADPLLQVVRGEASWLHVAPGADDELVTTLVDRVAEAGSAAHGAFLLLELWPGTERFRVVGPAGPAPTTATPPLPPRGPPPGPPRDSLMRRSYTRRRPRATVSPRAPPSILSCPVRGSGRGRLPAPERQRRDGADLPTPDECRDERLHRSVRRLYHDPGRHPPVRRAIRARPHAGAPSLPVTRSCRAPMRRAPREGKGRPCTVPPRNPQVVQLQRFRRIRPRAWRFHLSPGEDGRACRSDTNAATAGRWGGGGGGR